MDQQELLNEILSKIEDIDVRLDKVSDQVGGIDKCLDKMAVAVLNVEEQQKSAVKKIDLDSAKSDIITEIDGFVKLHKNLDHELVAMRSKYERLEGRLELVEQKVGLSS